MFSNLTKNQQVYVIDKSNDGDLRIGVVGEIKLPSPYQFQPMPMQIAVPFDITVKYEDGSEEPFGQVQPSTTVVTYNNGNIILCDSREAAQIEIDKISAYSRKHLELVTHYEKLLKSTEKMKSQLDPRYAKDQKNDEEIKNLKSNMSDISSKLDNMIQMVTQYMSSSKKSNN